MINTWHLKLQKSLEEGDTFTLEPVTAGLYLLLAIPACFFWIWTLRVFTRTQRSRFVGASQQQCWLASHKGRLFPPGEGFIQVMLGLHERKHWGHRKQLDIEDIGSPSAAITSTLLCVKTMRVLVADTSTLHHLKYLDSSRFTLIDGSQTRPVPWNERDLFLIGLSVKKKNVLHPCELIHELNEWN